MNIIHNNQNNISAYHFLSLHNKENIDDYYLENSSGKILSSEDIVKKDETLTTIATRLNISDYMMLEKNKETVDDYDDLDEDEEILIPNLYCKKITFYVDKDNFLPIRQLIYDDIGLFEEYQYANLLNP